MDAHDERHDATEGPEAQHAAEHDEDGAGEGHDGQEGQHGVRHHLQHAGFWVKVVHYLQRAEVIMEWLMQMYYHR